MVAEGNVGVAFGLVAAAGMATCLGACIVFCASLAQPRLLAGSLGFAAGVMLYVSFSEILMRKSIAGFQGGLENTSADVAFRWATLCFFGGMAIIAILDRFVHAIAHWGAGHSMRKAGAQRGAAASTSTANLLSHEDQREARHSRRSRHAVPSGTGAGTGGSGRDSLPPPVAVMQRTSGDGLPGQRDVEDLGSAGNTPRAAVNMVNPVYRNGGSASDSDDDASVDPRQRALSSPVPSLTEPCDAMTSAVMAASCPETVVGAGATDEGRGTAGGGDEEGEGVGGGGTVTTSRTPPAVVEIMEADHHSFMLKKMGLLTALAIFIHNFPEGLATFVGALADTKVGVGLAVAIAMHNIPEGICVAMPIYYATGSRWKGFMWALLSGLSEPVGALVGYLALNGSSDLSFAIVFGLVAGMMVYISVKELIPTALRYDPKDSVATTCVILGMIVMAASLLLFTI